MQFQLGLRSKRGARAGIRVRPLLHAGSVKAPRLTVRP